MLRLTKRSAASTEINDPGEHLPENETHVVYKCFTSSELLVSLVPRKDISKRKKTTKCFQSILIENIIYWWSGYVSKACCRQLVPTIETVIPDYRRLPTQRRIEWADAALTAGGRRDLHLLLDLGSSAGSVDQNCSQKSQANVYAWHRSKFPSGVSLSHMSIFKDKMNARGKYHMGSQGIRKFLTASDWGKTFVEAFDLRLASPSWKHRYFPGGLCTDSHW